jgi:hypothetical protein
VTNTSTAAEFAELSIAAVTSVLLNKPVTNDGVMSNVVNVEFGVLMKVSSTVMLGEPPLRAPLAVLTVHCAVEIVAVKLPLLCAEAKGDVEIANARIIPGSNSL